MLDKARSGALPRAGMSISYLTKAESMMARTNTNRVTECKFSLNVEGKQKKNDRNL